jgi:predicted aspartyl protease
MIYQYKEDCNPPAPILRITVSNLLDGARRLTADALVDTGADITCLPKNIVKTLGAEPISTYSLIGINETNAGVVNSYLFEFEIASIIKQAEAVAVGDELILGRNLINEFVLQLDGPNKKINLMSS